MRNLVLIIICFLYAIISSAQELNCKVTINSDQLSQGDLPVFKTLERSLNDFVNKGKWSNRTFKDNERINAQMFITITKYESNRFEGNIQIQSSRPVYNSSYETPVFNFKDNNLNFQYIEFQPLIFNENVYDSNLVGVVAYYINIMLGLDADTFTLEGGTDHFLKAQQITTQGQSTSYKGWDSTEKRSRFTLIDDMLSNTYRKYRLAMYNYHRKGLDILGDNNSTGKQVIAGTIRLFESIDQRQTNSFLVQTFFDAKSDEIRSIFSDGPKVDIVKLKETLSKVAPSYSATWNDIKY
jgi:hypothetical protein